MELEIGNRIRELREERGMTQDELAKVVNVSRQTISKWELGKSQPDIESLWVLSNYFQVNIDVLVGRKNRSLFSLLKTKEGRKKLFDNDDSDRRREEFLTRLTDPLQALKSQSVDVVFKIDDEYYPNYVDTYYIFELSEDQMNFYGKKYDEDNWDFSITTSWKNEVSLMKTFDPAQIQSIKIYSQKHLTLTRGFLPSTLVYLYVTISFFFGDTFHLICKSISVAEKIIEWAEKHGITVIDKENMKTIFAEDENPVETIKANAPKTELKEN